MNGILWTCPSGRQTVAADCSPSLKELSCPLEINIHINNRGLEHMKKTFF